MILDSADQAIQNVVVELGYTQNLNPPGQSPQEKSIFVGWTGLSSQWRDPGAGASDTASKYNARQGINGAIDIDSTFGSMLGLSEKQIVRRTIVLVCTYG